MSPSSLPLPDPIPVSVITGFLGSGKTTLLRHLLADPAMADAAVIINEFGEVGLDHHLVEASSDDVVVMSSGCLCCTIRGDLVDTLRRLFERRQRGELPPFRRVLIETTGLADPAPVLHTLMEQSRLGAPYVLDGVLTTVDAELGSRQLDRQPESVKQAAVADRLILTKIDLAGPDAVARMRTRLLELNPGAPIVEAIQGAVDAGELFGVGLYDPRSKSQSVRDWLRAEAYPAAEELERDHAHGHRHDVNRHGAEIRADCFVYESPLRWRLFSPNLASLVSRHAEKLLRVKGILNIEGEPNPVVVHGVQHQFQRMRLNAWPDADRRSRLVVISRGLDRRLLADWLQDEELFEPDGGRDSRE
ncbi:MAG: GTP-binding protein [Burkholderiaceae bacterium]|nr:GTP-binding protein [Burkholderiaceae bacterium]